MTSPYDPIPMTEVLHLRGKLREIKLLPRSIPMIATEINTHMLEALMKRPGKTPTWVSYARPYVSAMREISGGIESRYYADSAYEIVLRCMCNLQSWRGEDARRIKAELQSLLDSCPVHKRL
jgi:hypothetical protein